MPIHAALSLSKNLLTNEKVQIENIHIRQRGPNETHCSFRVIRNNERNPLQLRTSIANIARGRKLQATVKSRVIQGAEHYKIIFKKL